MKFQTISYGLILLLAFFVELSNQKQTNTDVLAKLQKNHPSCELRSFVQTDEQHDSFKTDLSKYCSASSLSPATIEGKLLCGMIYSELKRACVLTSDNHITPAKYNAKTTAEKICSMKDIQSTNEWIWKIINAKNTEVVGINTENLCQKLTSNNTDLLRLVRFFYKIAPVVRDADLKNSKQGGSVSSGSNTTSIVNDTEASQPKDQSVEKKPISSKEGITNANQTIGTSQTANSTDQGTTISTDKSLSTLDNKTDSVVNLNTTQTEKKSENLKEPEKTASVSSKNSSSESIPNSNGTVQHKNTDTNTDSTQNKIEKTPKTDDKSSKNEKNTDDNDEAEDDDKNDGDDEEDTGDAEAPSTKKISKTKSKQKDDQTTDQKGKQSSENNSKDNKEPETSNKTETKPIESNQTLASSTSSVVSPITTQSKKKNDTNSVDNPVDNENQETDDYDADGENTETKGKDDNQDDTADGDDRSQLDDDREKTEKVAETKKEPIQEEKKPERQKPEDSMRKPEPEPQIKHPKFSKQKYPEDEGWSGSFVTYFLLFTLFVVVGYLVLHNKNKVLGLLIEGCRRDRSSTGRRNGASSSLGRYQRVSQSS